MITLQIGDKSITFPKDARITREIETSWFDRDLKATDFTYPVDLPLSQEVKTALGLPDVLANPNLKQEYDAELVIDGWPVGAVKLRIISTNIDTQMCQVSLIGDYGSYARLVGNKKLNQLYLDGVRSIGSLSGSSRTLTVAKLGSNIGPATWEVEYYPCTSDAHLNAIADGSLVTDYVFPMAVDLTNDLPVIHDALQKTPEGEIPGYQDNFNTPTSYSYLYPGNRNFINAYYYNNSGDKGYRDPVWEYIANTYRHQAAGVAPTTVGTTSVTLITTDRFFWVPMFKISYVLRKCFEEFGYKVSGDVFSNPAFLEKVLYNTYSINYCTHDSSLTNLVTGGGTPYKKYKETIRHWATSITPQNHMPDISVTDFITECTKLFNLQLIFNHTNMTVEIRQLQNLVPNGNVIDISANANPAPVINFEDDKFNKGYQFIFERDDHNAAVMENVKDDIGSYPLKGSVNNFGDLAAITGMVAFDLYYVKSENAYYQYSGAQWDFYSHCLQEYKTDPNTDDLQKISCKMTPATTMVNGQMCVRENLNYAADPFHTYMTGNMLLPYSKIGIQGNNLLGLKLARDLSLSGEYYYANGDWKAVTITKTGRKYNPVYINYMGLQKAITGNTKLYPYGSFSRYDADGIAKGTGACVWATPLNEGVYVDFWKQFVAKLQGSVETHWEVLLTPLLYSQLKLNENFITIDSLLYIAKKGTINQPLPDISKMVLIRV